MRCAILCTVLCASQYSHTVFGAVWAGSLRVVYNVVQYGAVWWDLVRSGAVYSAVWCGVVRCGAVYGVVR